MPPRTAIAVTTAFMLTVTSCAGEPPAPPAAPPAPALSAPPELEDHDIEGAVGRVLSADRAAKDAYVHVRVAEGMVELVGDVPTFVARRRMTQLVEQVRGVRSVSNRLEVRAAGKADEKIEDDVRKVLLLDPVAELFEVLPTVEDGVVRLDGRASSWIERGVAEDLVAGVAGVRGVDNRITLARRARPDDAIAGDIREALRWDAVVRDEKIVVWVENGVVELSGFVGSAAERSRAIARAHIEGVTRVDAGALLVAWRLSRTDLRRDDSGGVPDVELQKALDAALRSDPRLRHFSVRALVDEGRVMLEGVVDNLRAARLAEELAASTFGARAVDSSIEVRPTALADDDTLRELVELALSLDAATADTHVDVNVESGRVVVTGVAPHPHLGSDIERVAAGIRGVLGFEAALSVAPAGHTVNASPRAAAALVPTNVVYRDPLVLSYRSDDEIERAIENALAWTARLDARSIEVEVDEGRATLEGEVDDLPEGRLAEAVALTAGASAVDNRLRLFAAP